MELATAALFLLSLLRFGLSPEGGGAVVLSFLLLGLAVMDAETLRLPDAFTLPGIALGILFAFSKPVTAMSYRLENAGLAILWAFVASALLLLIRWIYRLVRHREGLGLGDVKLIALIAAWLGPAPTLLTLIVGCVAAAIFGVVSVAFSRGITEVGHRSPAVWVVSLRGGYLYAFCWGTDHRVVFAVLRHRAMTDPEVPNQNVTTGRPGMVWK